MGGAEKGRDQEDGDKHRDGGGDGDGVGTDRGFVDREVYIRSTADNNNNNILSPLLSSILKSEDQYLVGNCFVMVRLGLGLSIQNAPPSAPLKESICQLLCHVN